MSAAAFRKEAFSLHSCVRAAILAIVRSSRIIGGHDLHTDTKGERPEFFQTVPLECDHSALLVYKMPIVLAGWLCKCPNKAPDELRLKLQQIEKSE